MKLFAGIISFIGQVLALFASVGLFVTSKVDKAIYFLMIGIFILLVNLNQKEPRITIQIGNEDEE